MQYSHLLLNPLKGYRFFDFFFILEEHLGDEFQKYLNTGNTF